MKITTDRRPFFNGRAATLGETIMVSSDESKTIVDNGWGEIAAAPKKKKRARDASGRLKADDKSTPHINEAYEIED